MVAALRLQSTIVVVCDWLYEAVAARPARAWYAAFFRSTSVTVAFIPVFCYGLHPPIVDASPGGEMTRVPLWSPIRLSKRVKQNQ